jgi:flagellar M-ring protein FliF
MAMNEAVSQLLLLLKSMPASKKLGMLVVVALLIAGFAALFMLANRVDYQVLFNNVAAQDAGAIIEELKKRNVPYKIEGNGTLIMVPAEKVYDLRLSLVSKGYPKEGSVGFEIFDKTDFKTTRFVQELNYRRALQGELARTIGRFKEVDSAKVFIVLPKESLFVEAKKSPSASIQLDLRSNLPAEKLAGIIHLVASAVEGLDPEQVTVVDTRGRVIFKGGNNASASGLLSGMQLDYKGKIEADIRNNVQSMLEGIVGAGKAIVRVTAEIDFNKITLNEEEYDPSSTVVRSKRDIEESSQAGNNTTGSNPTIMNERAGVIPSENSAFNGKSKKDIVTNYEINKVTRAIFKPAGTVTRLSVAAVIDGTYQIDTLEDGTDKRTYVPRSEEELSQFEAIVKSAMGYSEDREDQISVSSIPFSDSEVYEEQAETQKFDVFKILNDSKKLLVNIFLMVLVFFLLIRPMLKSLKKMASEPVFKSKQLQTAGEGVQQIPATENIGHRERMLEISKSDPEKTEQLIKNWIGE